MSTTGKAIAWICIFSLLFLGCYTTSVIDPRAASQERLQSGTILKAVTRDDSTHEFDKAHFYPWPRVSVTADSVVGSSHGRRIALPLSEVSQLHVKEYDGTKTAWAVVGGVAAVGAIAALFYALGDLGSIGRLSGFGK